MIKVEPYYAPNQLTEVFCEIAAFPEPNITWSYLKCPDYPSCVNSTNIALTVRIIYFVSTLIVLYVFSQKRKG